MAFKDSAPPGNTPRTEIAVIMHASQNFIILPSFISKFLMASSSADCTVRLTEILLSSHRFAAFAAIRTPVRFPL